MPPPPDPRPDLPSPTRTRRAHDAVLAAVTTGKLTIAGVLDLVDTDDTTGRIMVTRLLAALPGVAPEQVDRLMTHLDLAHTRRLGSLDALERLDLRTLSRHQHDTTPTHGSGPSVSRRSVSRRLPPRSSPPPC